MSNKTELKIQKQIEYVNTIIQGLEDEGHEIDIDVTDMLDELGTFGLELTPIKGENIPSLAYIHLIDKMTKQGDN
jgi:hypothetical protein